MPLTRVKLDAFGRILIAEHSATGWKLYDIGNDGKRSPARDIVVPDFIGVAKIYTFIGDMLHETATPRHPSVRRLALSGSGDSPTLRRLETADASTYQVFRLSALREAPGAFGASLEEESTLSPAQVCERITPSNDGAPFVYGAFNAEHEIVGACGFYRERARKMRHIGWVWGMFVDARFRGGGLGRVLLNRVIADARVLFSLRQVQLRVGIDNTTARALYTSAGFKQVAVLPRALQTDGHYIDEAVMILDLAEGS